MAVKATTEKNFRRAKVKPAKKRAARRWWSWRAAAVLAVTLVSAYAIYRATALVLYAEALQVRWVKVHGNERISNGEVQALMHDVVGTSILVADLAQYRSRLLESPWVADVEMRRVLPATVEVFVSERRPIGLCRLGTELYLLDRTGTIIDEYGPQYAEFDLPLIDGVVGPATSEPAIDPRRTELAARVIEDVAGRKALAARLSQIDVSDPYDAVVLLDGDSALLHVGTERFAERLQSYTELAAAFRQRVADIDYVDLRFDDHIYVRPADADGVRVARRPPAGN